MSDYTTGLAGRWQFASDASDSVGSNDGTITGATLVDGHISLDGSDDFVSIPHDESHGFGGDDVTVSLWLKTTTTDKSTIWLKAYGDGGGDSLFTLEVNNSAANKLRLFWRNSAAGGSGTCISTEDINTGVFRHVVAVKSGGDLKLYVDGQLDTTASGLSGDFTATLFYLGKWDHQSYNGQDFFNGDLDDFRVYARALTDADVTALYDAGRDPAEASAPSAYTIDMISVSTDAPSGAVGFEKGDEEAFFISSQSPYSVYFYIAGAWDHHDGGLFSIGMTFAWPDGATRAYVQGSAAGQNVFKSVREIEDGYMYDTDDPDNVIDKFRMTGATFDVSEHQVTVSGTDDIVLGVASDFVQIIESGALSHDYTVQVGASTTVSPPEGKDGTALLIRIFKAES